MARAPSAFFLLLLVAFLASVQAFLGPAAAPLQRRASGQRPQQLQELRLREALPVVSRPLQQQQLQQQSAAPLGVRGRPLQGIFGLGTPELVVIALVAGIVLGPDKIVDLARGVGKAAGELKAVPQEFESGLKSGEEAAIKTKQELAKKKEETAAEKK